MRACPCGSGQEFKACCLPYHLGTPAPDAERLMRSRYSAYAVGNIDYIVRTTHPNNPDAKKPIPQRRKEAKAFSEATTFEKLDVLEFVPGERQATVTFHAHLRQGNKDVSFTEKSAFEKINNQWLYLESLSLSSA